MKDFYELFEAGKKLGKGVSELIESLSDLEPSGKVFLDCSGSKMRSGVSNWLGVSIIDGVEKDSMAMHHASRIEEIALMVEQGNIEPQTAKVAIDAKKWIASRFHPRQFSEMLFEIKKTEEKSLSKIHLEELRMLMKIK